jgi:hypothetical protein
MQSEKTKMYLKLTEEELEEQCEEIFELPKKPPVSFVPRKL